MELRRLGSSDLEISRLGFGAWSIGGSGWAYDGYADRDKTSLQALAHAVGEGVNWVDTAPTYGQGHSEELVGRAVRQLGSERALIFTKCGRHWDSPTAQPRSDLRPEAIRADCEASLRRRGVEVIDLLQIHWPESPPHTPIEESWTQMRRLVDEGKIRAAGVSNFGVDLLERCEAVGHVDSVQLPFSLIARKSADGLLQWCAEHDTGVLAYSPMQIGLLTGLLQARKDPCVASGRLETPPSGVSKPEARAESHVSRWFAPGRQRPRRECFGGRHRMGAGLAAGDRCDRRRTHGGPGR